MHPELPYGQQSKEDGQRKKEYIKQLSTFSFLKKRRYVNEELWKNHKFWKPSLLCGKYRLAASALSPSGVK